jgi:hypothetical protein
MMVKLGDVGQRQDCEKKLLISLKTHSIEIQMKFQIELQILLLQKAQQQRILN